jgi:hypothetical protein
MTLVVSGKAEKKSCAKGFHCCNISFVSKTGQLSFVAQTIFEEKDFDDLGEMKNSILLLRLLFVRYSMMRRLVVVSGKAAYIISYAKGFYSCNIGFVSK